MCRSSYLNGRSVKCHLFTVMMGDAHGGQSGSSDKDQFSSKRSYRSKARDRQVLYWGHRQHWGSFRNARQSFPTFLLGAPSQRGLFQSSRAPSLLQRTLLRTSPANRPNRSLLTLRPRRFTPTFSALNFYPFYSNRIYDISICVIAA